MEERNHYGHDLIAEALRRKPRSFPEVAQKGGDTSGNSPWVFVLAGRCPERRIAFPIHGCKQRGSPAARRVAKNAGHCSCELWEEAWSFLGPLPILVCFALLMQSVGTSSVCCASFTLI